MEKFLSKFVEDFPKVSVEEFLEGIQREVSEKIYEYFFVKFVEELLAEFLKEPLKYLERKYTIESLDFFKQKPIRDYQKNQRKSFQKNPWRNF